MERKNQFLSEILRTLEEKDWTQMRTFSSEAKSLYSDLSSSESFECWQLSIPKLIKNSPRDLIANLIILSKVRPFWYDYFILFCAEQCRKFNYEGKWRLLHKLAKLYYPELIMYRITEEMSGNDYFGNIDKLVNKHLANFLIDYRKLKLPRPKFPQRKRGYNDHGSRKNPHEVHDLSTVSGKNPEREDYIDQYKKRSILLNFLYG